MENEIMKFLNFKVHGIPATLGALFSVASISVASADTIKIDGSSTVYPLLKR